MQRLPLLLGFALGLVAAAPAAARQDPQGKPEEIPLVDPYTRAAPKALERAGYASLGPFAVSSGVGTDDVERALGGVRVLWVESAHFKLGSTLASYRSGVDNPEDKKLRAELARLAKKFAHFEPQRNPLDPWLRLHLFAQRLEDQYGEFLARFGFGDLEFPTCAAPPLPGAPALGSGPYMGMEQKPAVLLTEDRATLERFLAAYSRERDPHAARGRLADGTLFLAESAEDLRQNGFELDSALHCAVAALMACNLVDGFRGYHDSTPEWFRSGLAIWFSRRVDERWATYARGTTFTHGDDSWKWPPRVRGLVANRLAPPWSKMLEWKSWEEIDGPGHMLVWSRVDWLLARKDADLRAFLLGMTEPAIGLAQQEQSLRTAFGASPAELDARWREFVLRSTPAK